MKKTSQKGFTLIELMIVVAIIGILAAIAIPAFLDYMNKGKQTEASLQLDNMEKKIKTYHIEKAQLPDDAALTPATTACASAGGKIPKISQSAWVTAGGGATAGWGQMGFHVDDDLLYQYSWDRASSTTGQGLAVGDLDCDGTVVNNELNIEVVEGNVQATQVIPQSD